MITERIGGNGASGDLGREHVLVDGLGLLLGEESRVEVMGTLWKKKQKEGAKKKKSKRIRRDVQIKKQKK